MIEAVLFDNDGVLVDTETLFFETTRRAFEQLGLNLTCEVWGRRYLSEGKSSRQIAISLGADASRVDTVISGRNEQYWKVLQSPPALRPHVKATLDKLHGRFKLAIVTGCGRDQLELVHTENELLKFFDLIVTSDDCSDGKPHPEPYLNAMRRLGLGATQCIAIEDSPRGLASARAAGLRCVVVPIELTNMLEFPGALAIEKDLSGVLKHVQ
jgi:HAD superfamily hydrolase (TIGR01509 family)